MLHIHHHTRVQQLHSSLLKEKQISLSVLRLDELHPVVSGNKLFKLFYFLKEANEKNAKGILTFGGAYSNHLLATAFACKENGLASIGIVRGEAAPVLSSTLQQCKDLGMHLHFISREEYKNINDEKYLDELKKKYLSYIIIPEGGYHPVGAKGAALIMDKIDKNFTHICCAVGTATTIAGLILNNNYQQNIIAFPVLKGLNDLPERIAYLTAVHQPAHFSINNNYHFGGYAKHTPDLLAFMNELYKVHALPTDFVYTGKLLYGVMDCIKQDQFAKGSNIICIHTGGLQGNNSLPKGVLSFD